MTIVEVVRLVREYTENEALMGAVTFLLLKEGC